MVAPFDKQVQLLRTIPGIDLRSAQILLAEIGPDMNVFPNAWSLGLVGRYVPRAARLGRQARLG